MSTFYTAPPIYNTGGWGFRGDIPIFNPTGVLDDVGETGKVSVSSSFYHVSNEDRRFKITTSTSDIQYFTKENRRNVKLKLDPTFNLNNFIVPRVDFQIDPSFKSNYLIAPRIDFEINPNVSYLPESNVKINFQINLNINKNAKTKIQIPNFSNQSNIEELLFLPKEQGQLTINIGPSFRLEQNLSRFKFFIQPNISNASAGFRKQSKIFNKLDNISYSSKKRGKGKSRNNLAEINYFNKRIKNARIFNTLDINYFQKTLSKSFISSSIDGTTYFGKEISKAKNSFEPTLHHISNSRRHSRFSKFSSLDDITYFQKQIILDARNSITPSFYHTGQTSRFKYLLRPILQNQLNIDKRISFKLAPFFYHKKTQGIGAQRFTFINRLDNLNYKIKQGQEFVIENKLNNLNNFLKKSEDILKPKGTLSNITYLVRKVIHFKSDHTISNVAYPVRKVVHFSAKNILNDLNILVKPDQKTKFTPELNRVDYNVDSVPKEAKTESSFPTGIEFPKIRYSTAEPDYTKASTGSNTYGYLQYEGVEEGNLFYYEPDTGAYQWEYFHYGIRSGIFNPCEFPETADRTLDPVQISSRSNKKDNPFWYLPDLLTVDSTIHLADGAPCQYIAQENSRYAEIFLEDGLLLLPENYTNTGQLYTI